MLDLRQLVDGFFLYVQSNNVEIYNTELYLVDNVKSIEVEYYRDKVEIYTCKLP